MRAIVYNLFGVLLFLCVGAFATLAHADEPEPTAPVFELAGDAVVVRTDAGEQLVRIGCFAQSFATLGTQAFALCAPRTVVMIAAQPKPHIVERRVLVERIVSLTVVDGVLSARTSTGMRPLSDYAVAPPGSEQGVVQRRLRRPLSLHSPGYRAPLPETVDPTAKARGVELLLAGTTGPGLDPVGGFGLIDAQLVYRFEAPVFLAAYGTFGAATGSFDPGTRATGPNGGDVQVVTGEALIGLDSRFVAAGIGAGVALMDRGYDVEPIFTLRGRFGERDRFEFRWHMAFATGGPDIVGMFGGALEFRLTPRWWLGASAEVGNERYGRLMLDVRHRLSGDGGPGTLDLRGSAGLAYVHSSSALANSSGTPKCSDFSGGGDTECVGTNADYLGPALSLAIIWRP